MKILISTFFFLLLYYHLKFFYHLKFIISASEKNLMMSFFKKNRELNKKEKLSYIYKFDERSKKLRKYAF